MATVDITMGLPTFHPHGRDEELAWYRKIDEGPWNGLATWDRFTYPGWALTVQLAAAAAVTERVRLWTNIATLPPRNAVLFAKEIATIDVLSGGRLTLGVGIGAHDEDYVALGSELEMKRQRMDEHVATMRKIWAQEPPVEGYPPVGPRPLQPGGVPFVAGVSGPKALARAARWATGVNDPNQTACFDGKALDAQRGQVMKAWTNAGREERPHFSTCVYFALGPNAREQLREHLWDYARTSYGDEIAGPYAETATNYGRAGLLDAVNGALDAGLDNLILIPTTADPDEIDRARDVLGI